MAGLGKSAFAQAAIRATESWTDSAKAVAFAYFSNLPINQQEIDEQGTEARAFMGRIGGLWGVILFVIRMALSVAAHLITTALWVSVLWVVFLYVPQQLFHAESAQFFFWAWTISIVLTAISIALRSIQQKSVDGVLESWRVELEAGAVNSGTLIGYARHAKKLKAELAADMVVAYATWIAQATAFAVLAEKEDFLRMFIEPDPVLRDVILFWVRQSFDVFGSGVLSAFDVLTPPLTRSAEFLPRLITWILSACLWSTLLAQFVAILRFRMRKVRATILEFARSRAALNQPEWRWLDLVDLRAA